MAGTPTTKHGLDTMAGTDAISTIDATHNSAMATLDSIIAKADKGVLASRPTSSGGTPGKSGFFYYATDTGQLFFDHGTGWIEITEAAQGNLSSRPAAGVRGRVYTDEFGTIWRDSGSAWLLDGGVHPSALIYLSGSNQSLSNNTFTHVLFNGELEDVWAMHAAGTSALLTVPYAGLWRFDVSAIFNPSATGTRTVYLTRNSALTDTSGTIALTRQAGTSEAGGNFTTLSASARLTAGDVIRVLVLQNSGGALGLVAGTAPNERQGTFLAAQMLSS